MARKKVDPEKRTEQLGKLKEKKLEFHIHADKDGKNLYPGVFYLLSKKHSLGKEEEPVYYIRYRTGEGSTRQLRFEQVGCKCRKKMTAAKASGIREDRIKGKVLPNSERREVVKAAKEAEKGKLTFSKLWDAYKVDRPDLKGIASYETIMTRYLSPAFGDKEPCKVVPLDVDRLRLTLSKKKTPGTVKNVLELLRRLSNFAANKHLCPPLPFRVTLPRVNNVKTEDLNAEQMTRLLTVLRDGTVTDKDGKKTILDPDAREMMLLALLSGMRRGEILRLKWADVDYQRGFLTLREPKGGTDQLIPISDEVRKVLEGRTRTDSPYIFPGRKLKDREDAPRADAAKSFRAIRAAAKLPKDFRPMHGLRHVFASSLASSGEVDLYTLQRLLTHKSPTMTQRYAHLRDDTLKRAANVAGRIMEQAEPDAKEGTNE